jgi:hypothetical protein
VKPSSSAANALMGKIAMIKSNDKTVSVIDFKVLIIVTSLARIGFGNFYLRRFWIRDLVFFHAFLPNSFSHRGTL